MSEKIRSILDSAVDPKQEAIEAAVAQIKAAISELPNDPGAAFTADAVNAWSTIESGSPADWVRLKQRAKRAGASVTEIDRRVRERKTFSSQQKVVLKFPQKGLDPLATRPEGFRSPLGTLSKSGSTLSPGALTYVDGENPKRLIESMAAEVVADALRGRLAWDAEAGSWQIWCATHWQPLNVPAEAEALIADAVHIGTHPLGFRIAYLSGITQIAQRRGLLRRQPPPKGVIPFANGLLDIQTMTLEPATPDRACDWCLPHNYEPAADCPTIKAWLERCVEGDQASVELLRAWLAALVRGVTLQVFLTLLGRGGSGKGTFQRLAVALIGVGNAVTSSLRDLETNRFETAKLYGKRLCNVNEAGKHGGSLNMLKAITGGDHVPLERKHQQQTGSFVFDGLVLLASNEDLQSSDLTSGLDRRRVIVRFPKTATQAERAAWIEQGGEDAVLHREIPGLINWLLEMPERDIRRQFEEPPLRVLTDNLLGMTAGNSVADWLISKTAPAPGNLVQIGTKEERRDREDGRVYFENAEVWLYASYLTHCMQQGRKNPVGAHRFSEVVIDTAETLGHRLTKRQHPVRRVRCIDGLELSEEGEALWAKAAGTAHAAKVELEL